MTHDIIFLSQVNFFVTRVANDAVWSRIIFDFVNLLAITHDCTSLSGPKLRAHAALAGAMESFARRRHEVFTWKRGLFREFWIIVKRGNLTATGALEHGKHEPGCFTTTAAAVEKVSGRGRHVHR